MARGLKLSSEEKGQITAYHNDGRSNRWIARTIGRSLNVINNFIKNPTNYGKKKSSGRKKKLSDRQKREIIRKASNSTISCAKIKQQLDLNVHRNTVRNVLVKSPNIVRRKLKSAPAINNEDKNIRLEFARQNMNTNWNCVCFLSIGDFSSFFTKNFLADLE